MNLCASTFLVRTARPDNLLFIHFAFEHRHTIVCKFYLSQFGQIFTGQQTHIFFLTTNHFIVT